ncbi:MULTISPECIES: LPS assembly lipoprotein LptE [Marinovum]|jgi:LPS-assembly lipoprotein|uniref:LPS assembly lipoprotein LptE n=1 Tax=Marinovum TaxID=367771 RepID=UPI00237B52ED|nr:MULTISPECIES: LPS assembly lipoprotein LptE [Marinovum]MDD9745531.1 LPS assembly lipoprotein LptE [Marinovum sp. PR37]
MWLSDRRSLLFGAAAAMTLAGCGFAPAYGTGGAASRLQNALRIEEPDSQNAYFVTRRIEERLGAGGASAPYELDLIVSLNEESSASTSDGALTRYQVLGRVTYALRRTGETEVLDTNTVRHFTGYSASGSTVATLQAKRDAEERMMVILADRVVQELVLAAPDL